MVADIFKNLERNKNLRSAILQEFISGLMTDDERAELNGLPEGCRMRENAKIYSPENFKCGKYVWIGENAKIDASGGLEIGEHTSIGLDVFIWSHTSHLANLNYDNVIGSKFIKHSKTVIGKGCFIAGPSVIFPGVTIGDQVIVEPMSTIKHDIPSNSLVSGNPGKVIKKIDQKTIDRISKGY